MKKAINKGLVLVNGNVGYTADHITGGETIELCKIDHHNNTVAIDLKLEIIFEDDYLAVVNKPSGIVVSGNKKWTLEHALSGNLKLSTQSNALVSPEPIHRLDYPTSGALLIGKTTDTVVALNKLFSERKIKKTYAAVTIGRMDKEGVIQTPVDGKPSETFFNTTSSIKSERFGFLNLVELNPLTGRRHQIRKHLVEIGNPILGDREYCPEGLLLSGKGLYLHASTLNFKHPVNSKQIEAHVELPKKFHKLFPK